MTRTSQVRLDESRAGRSDAPWGRSRRNLWRTGPAKRGKSLPCAPSRQAVMGGLDDLFGRGGCLAGLEAAERLEAEEASDLSDLQAGVAVEQQVAEEGAWSSSRCHSFGGNRKSWLRGRGRLGRGSSDPRGRGQPESQSARG